VILFLIFLINNPALSVYVLLQCFLQLVLANNYITKVLLGIGLTWFFGHLFLSSTYLANNRKHRAWPIFQQTITRF